MEPRRSPLPDADVGDVALTANRIRVLVAEDSPHMRLALEELLTDASKEFDLVAVVSDAEGAVNLSKALRPDVALLDVRMPGGGPAATVGIREVSPQTQILAYSAADDRESVLGMLRAGARGYVVKDASSADLIDGLRMCAAGKTTLSSSLSQHLVAELADEAERNREDQHQRREREERILALLRPGAIRSVFQPIFELQNGGIVGYEGLARLSDDDGSPEGALAEAGELGLSAALEIAMVRAHIAAFRQANAAASGCYLAVNATASVVATDAFIDAARPVPGEHRVVEITEHSDDAEDVLDAAVTLAREADIRVAIDDAGAGFSGLRRMLTISPDVVKLDRSLVTGLDMDRSKRALVAALARYCQEMEYSIVAEGIETEAELDTLRSLGVDHGQGYLLGRPGSLDENSVVGGPRNS